ncbi:T9SS type A sorting domain-containing protein [Botryobacter ruber]|uniref:T9SS type A sorting domain-containing protein n=1 Tax=Botryobacter ruber TaxID=2171629 RepID=UPI0013E2CFE4|nr:T9SS type A sorting domain-containing protein [Botryobacter ruber]
MKRYILFFAFIFIALLSATAQKNDPCKVRPISVFNSTLNEDGLYDPVTLPHNPCEQVVEIYMILKENPTATVNWQVVRSEMSTVPAEGWIIVDKDNNSLPGSAAGFTFTEPGPNGKSYFAAAIRSGRKNGVVKATVTDPTCGTKVATLPVRPGLLPVTLTDGGCTDATRTFTAAATPSKQPNSVKGYVHTWTFPNYWSYSGSEAVTAGPTGYSMVTTADVNTASFVTAPDPTPATEETVSVEVVALYKGNSGNGVGNANCDFGFASVVAESCVEVVGCPAGTFVTGETVAGNEMTITYQGAFISGSNTTVNFDISSEENIEQIFIPLILLDPTATATATVSNSNYTATYDATTSSVIYTRTGTGSDNLSVDFTLATGSFLEVYGLVIEDINGGGISTTYTGETFGELICEFGELSPFAAELVSFSGKPTPSGVELSWTTASEQNNDRFDVQRSSNGKDFKTIGTVKGAGNSSTALSYSFTDKSAAKGTNYYRLTMVETGGTTEYSNIIAIESSAVASTGMTLYPNPVTGSNVNIALDEPNISNKTFVVIITDMNGRKVMEQQVSTTSSDQISLSLDQTKVTKGLYMIKLQGDNLLKTQKLLVR